MMIRIYVMNLAKTIEIYWLSKNYKKTLALIQLNKKSIQSKNLSVQKYATEITVNTTEGGEFEWSKANDSEKYYVWLHLINRVELLISIHIKN